MFTDGLKDKGVDSKIQVLDVAEIVAISTDEIKPNIETLNPKQILIAKSQSNSGENPSVSLPLCGTKSLSPKEKYP